MRRQGRVVGSPVGSRLACRGAVARGYRAHGVRLAPTCPGFWLCVLEGHPLREWEFPLNPASTDRSGKP